MRRRLFLANAAIAVGAGVSAGCLGGNSTEQTDPPEESPEETPVPTPENIPEMGVVFNYDVAGDLLTLTHSGGDSVDPGTVYISGSGFADVDGADLVQEGYWTEATGQSEPVSAGDSVSLGVESNYQLEVIWQAPDYDFEKVLASDEGPNA